MEKKDYVITKYCECSHYNVQNTDNEDECYTVTETLDKLNDEYEYEVSYDDGANVEEDVREAVIALIEGGAE